jgi:hypothetical protein
MTPDKTKTVNFRFTENDLFTLEWLSALQQVSRTEVLRKAIALVRDLTVVANRDAIAVLETLRERYKTGQEVTLWVSKGADGEPEAHVLIDGNEPEDLGAVAMRSPGGDEAIVFLDLHDADAELVVPVRDNYMRVRPRFHAGVLPWPPGPLRIVIPLKDLEPMTIPDDVLASLEPVEA